MTSGIRKLFHELWLRPASGWDTDEERTRGFSEALSTIPQRWPSGRGSGSGCGFAGTLVIPSSLRRLPRARTVSVHMQEVFLYSTPPNSKLANSIVMTVGN